MIPGWGAAAAALQAVLGCAAPEPSADLAARRAMVAAAGSRVMPFDLDAKVHVFEKTGSGGIQQVVAETRDPRQTALVREHLEVEAGRFARGDFHDPAIQPGGLFDMRQPFMESVHISGLRDRYDAGVSERPPVADPSAEEHGSRCPINVGREGPEFLTTRLRQGRRRRLTPRPSPVGTPWSSSTGSQARCSPSLTSPCDHYNKDTLFPYFMLILGETTMLAKLTSKNQLTLPKAVTRAVEATDYFDVTAENGRIVLTPVRVNRADGVRAKLAELGLSEADVNDAVAWARSGR